MTLRVAIPIPQRQEGGMYTFLGYLRAWFDQQGIVHSEELDGEYDILFANSWAVPFEVVLKAKRARPGLRVVHRIDGAAVDYGRYDRADYHQARVNTLADLTVFQSCYSHFATRAKYHVIAQDGPVIVNSVDVERFQPGPARARTAEGRLRVANVSFSTNRRKGTWQLGRLAAENPDIEFVLCGRYPPLPELPNLMQMGRLGGEQIATVLGGCDVFLHLAENEACPNVVIEALASGLPVLYVDSGGTPELVGECGAPITVATFRERLMAVSAARSTLARAARARASARYAPDVVFPQYLSAMLACERRPLPSVRELWRLSLAGYPVLPGHPALWSWRARAWLADKRR